MMILKLNSFLKYTCILFVFLFGFFSIGGAESEEIKSEEIKLIIIVSSDVKIKEIDIATLNKIYRGRKTLWKNSNKISAYYVKSGTVTGDAFFKLLGVTYSKFNRYWRKKLFSSAGTPPSSRSNGQSVIDVVSKNESSIGVIPASLKDKIKSCKIIKIK
ncbi:MAG: hypothetical protein COA79_00860 [Planctomycetota bacterium]|nr:MAG: hypothetical protein COA79_00860 [Planctomycetota bacterium]